MHCLVAVGVGWGREGGQGEGRVSVFHATAGNGDSPSKDLASCGSCWLSKHLSYGV